MALDQKQLQKKRAKREQKRRQSKPGNAGSLGALSTARTWANVARAPIADVLIPTALFVRGIGTVWLSRHLPDGRYAVVGILLDVYCMGVKNALYTMIDALDYPGFLARIREDSAGSIEAQHPSCARKLVEGALAYAKDLGFEPHADYRIARAIFGDIDATACPERFVFGKDGKPFYVDGPNDTPAMKRRIVEQLERRCGKGGFDFMMMVSGPEP